MVSPEDGVKCGYQPVFGLDTGNVVAVAVRLMPPSGTVYDILRNARRDGSLTTTDAGLLSHAIRGCSEVPRGLPVRVSVLAVTVAGERQLADRLHAELRGGEHLPKQVVLTLEPPFSGVDKRALLDGVTRLRRGGFLIGVAGMGDGDVPFSVLTQLKPDVTVLDPTMVRGLAEDTDRIAFVEAITLLCGRLNCRLTADGVDDRAGLAVLKKFGVHTVSGVLLGDAAEHAPFPEQSIAPILGGLADAGWRPRSGPTLTAGALAMAAVTLPSMATAEDVRDEFAKHPHTASVVLVDQTGRPTGFIERNRFLMAVTGAYGHALHARRPAAGLAEPPRTVHGTAAAKELLELISAGPRQQSNDDIIATDDSGRCVGVVPAANAMRAFADLQIEHAARLHPLTGLPGTEAISADVAQRVADQQSFSVSWLDIDGFKSVNDTLGYAAGDELIKLLGRSLQATVLNRPYTTVAHIGGDDFLLVAALDDVLPLVATVLDRPVTVAQRTPTVSVATLVCAPGAIDGHESASRMLVPLKEKAKQLTGTSWVVGRPNTERIDVLRGRPSETSRAG